MSPLFDALRRRARAAAGVWTISAALTAVFLIAYRVKAYGLIRADYPELRLSFLGLLRASARGDALAFAGLTLLLAVVLLAAASSARALRLAAVGILSLETLFLSTAMTFFDVYQSPLQRGFLNAGALPGLHDAFASLGAEVSVDTLLRGALLVLLVAGSSLWLLRRAAQAERRWRPRYALAVPVAVLLGLGLLSVSPSHAESPDDASLLDDLSENPVSALVEADPDADPAPEDPQAARAPFSFHFDTPSLVSKKHDEGLPGVAKGKKYNVLFYFIESTAAQYLEEQRNGKPVAPVLKGLSEHAVVFKNHYADYPLSANAMLNVLCSAYDGPHKKPVVEEYSYIGLTCLPEALKAQGYRTYLAHTGMLGYANQDKFLSVRQFDRIEDKPKLEAPPYTAWVGWGLDDHALIKPTLRFIEEDPKKPFFAALFPVGPHHPYAIPDPSYSLGEIPKDADTHERIRLKYLDSLHYSDEVIGDLIAALKKAGALDDTLVFIFADHGEAFRQHPGNYNHPLFVYEENVHVPLMIYNPRLFPKGEVVEGISRHVDLMPTVLDLIGAPPQPLAEGISLASPHDEQLAISHTSYKKDLTAIRDGQWHYIERAKDGHQELYDLTADPHEKHNVAAAHHDVLERYHEVVARWRVHRDRYYERVLREYPMRQPPPAPPDAGKPASRAAAPDAGAAPAAAH